MQRELVTCMCDWSGEGEHRDWCADACREANWPQRRPQRYVVAIYELDRGFGGREEGGWWFDTGSLQRVLRVVTGEENAYRLARRVNAILALQRRNKQRDFDTYRYRELGSVLYAGGHYEAQVYEASSEIPQHYPPVRPHYE